MNVLHCLRALSATLIVAMASSCAGAPPSSQTIPSVGRNAQVVVPPSASPQATTSAQPTVSGQPIAPGQYVRGTGTPAFPTVLTSGPVTRDANGAVSQADAANTYVNVFDPSGAFAGQLDSAQTGANGQPIVRLTDPSSHQVQLNLPDVSGLPENTATTVGDLRITKDTPNELIAMSGLGLTGNGSYDSSSGTVVVQLSNNSQYRVPVKALLRQVASSRLHPRDSTDCALRIVALVAAITAMVILVVAAVANCGALASTPFGWVLLGGCLYTLGLLVASLAALVIALNSLRAECWPSPSPSPTATPVPTPTGTATPTTPSTPAATQTPTQAPAAPRARARHSLSFIFPLFRVGL